MHPKRPEYRSITRANQLIMPEGVERKMISFGIPAPILDLVKAEALEQGKSQARVITERLTYSFYSDQDVT